MHQLGFRAAAPPSHLFLAVAAFAFTVTSVSAFAPIPTGLAPGSKYHLLFNSSTLTNGSSADVSYYDQIVQNAANAAGMGSATGVSWTAILSTPAVTAREHAVVGATTPVFNMQLQRLADGYADFWDGQLDATVAWDENGEANTLDAWTGSLGSGLGDANFTVGNTAANPAAAWCGHPTSTNHQWMAFAKPNLTTQLHVFALSQELTVPSGADFDTDGNVDGADFLKWQRGLGSEYQASNLAAWTSAFGSSPMASIPEPSSLSIVSVLLLASATRELGSAGCGKLYANQPKR